MKSKMFGIEERKINTIIISNRARKDMGDLKTLIEGIKKSGQLNPILITPSGVLVAGERRLQAMKQLNKEHILTRIIPDDSKDNLLLIEHMENVARKDFVWHEELSLRYKLHKLWKEQAQEKKKTWGYRETAKKLNCSIGGLSTDLVLAEAIETFPELIECNTKNQAKDTYKKFGEQAAAIQSIENLSGDEKERFEHIMSGSALIKSNKQPPQAQHADELPDIGSLTDGSHDEQPVEDVEKSNLPDVVYSPEKYDTFLPKVPNNTVGMIELDPPYAIDFNANYSKLNKTKSKATDWTREKLFGFYQEILPILYQKLLDNSWILCWTGKEHFEETKQYAIGAGFSVQGPGIWKKPGGSANRPKSSMISNYEMYLLLAKGKPTFNTEHMLAAIDFPPVPSARRIHQWEKPIDLYDYFINILGKPGSIFLSLFTGSGNNLIAAAKHQMKPMGCEKNKKYIYRFYDNFKNYFGGV